jgi:CubicO group peptidase (beta-lactamase class C family)
MRIFILLFIISLTACTSGENTASFNWPENKITPIYKEFVKAYNTNDLEKLQAFTTKHYEKKSEKNAAYWPSVFADFGEIVPFSVSKKWSNENKLSIWFQGKHTKGWVMIQLRMNKKNTKIIGKGVMRGMKPPGKLPSYNHISSKKMIPYLKKYIGKLDKQDRFSGSVLIAKGNTILFEDTYGESNKMLGAKNNVNTSFTIASTTKTFTAVAIAKLVEQGKLKFTDPISKLIPEYPRDIADQVTIHHLLTHTSGIELDDYKPFNQDVKKARNMVDLLNAQITHIDSLNEGRRVNFKVLNEFDYSNENFALLGIIIERASGMTYAKYIEKNIFDPLDMKNSFADIHKLTNHQNKAIGYTYKNENSEFVGGLRRENDKMGGVFINPVGGIYSTTRDLYTYFKAINNHTVLSKQTQEILHKKHTENYGYGFYLLDDTIGHGGTYPGIGSCFTYYPNTDYYVIILSNYGSMAGSVIDDHIYDIIKSNNETMD